MSESRDVAGCAAGAAAARGALIKVGGEEEEVTA